MGTLSHLTAFLGAASTSLGALPTMIHVGRVFLALSRTGLADVSAELEHICRVDAAAGHERNGWVADFGAVTV